MNSLGFLSTERCEELNNCKWETTIMSLKNQPQWDIARDTVYTSNNNMGLVRFGRSGNGGFTPNIIRLFRLNTGVTYLLTSNCSGVHSFRETHEQAG